MKRRLLTALSALTVILAMASPVGATGPALQSGPDSDSSSETPQPRASLEKLQEVEITDVESFDPLKDAEDGIFIVRLEDEPVATYRGGIRGLEPTNPDEAGIDRLDVDAPSARAYVGHLETAHAEVLSTIERELNRSIDPVHEYLYALNGFALDLTVEEARRVSRMPGVSRVEPDRILQLETDNGPAWIGAPGLWGTDCDTYCGEGVIVGVLDTGINPENPSFAEVGPEDGYVHVNPLGADTFLGVCDPSVGDTTDHVYDPTFACNDKLIGAWSFIDPGVSSPIDDDGHGSHTASTAAGNFVSPDIVLPTITLNRDLSGVAPHANIIAYDVCDEDGCPNSATNAGIEQAIVDAVHVINYSIGSPSAVDPWQDSNSLAFLAAREAGIFVATSAGNEGPGDDTVGTPAIAPWLTSVAATTHDRAVINSLVDMTGGDTTPPADMEGKGITSGYGPAEIVWAGAVPSNNPEQGGTDTPELCGIGGLGDFISPWLPGTFSGEIVVCERGTFGRVEMGANVLAAGAGGYVLIDNGNGLVSDGHELPGVHISEEDGTVLKAWLATGSGHMATITGAVLDVSPSNADIMAGFSSRGSNRVAPIVSPNVAAPGVEILAANGTDGEISWGGLSGTSMASPHVAGSAALLMQANPGWTPAQVQSALMLTADTTVLEEDETTPADPFDMGSGRIQVDLAVNSPLVLHETIAGYENADPALGGDPTTINLASAANDACVLECSWTRTVTATVDGTWDVAATTASDFDLGVTPANFSLLEGESQDLIITADVSESDVDEWFFGEVSITGTGDDMHMPVAVMATRGDLPDLVSIEARRDAGSVREKDVTSIEIEVLTLELAGLSEANQMDLELSEDSNNDSPYDDLGDGVFWKTVNVPGGTWRAVFETFDSEAPDLDLFVGTGDTPSEATEVCSSTSPSATEYCNVWDPSGTMWVLVQNWDGSDSQPDAFTLAYGLVGAEQGNMLVEGPPDQPELEPFDMQVFWDLEDPDVGSIWYGAFSVGTSPAEAGNVGRVPVDLVRRPDDVTKIADDENPFPGDTVEFTITIEPNPTKTDLSYTIVDHVPDGLTYVPGSATGGLQLRNDGALTWEGVMRAVGDPTYNMTTSLTDPFCDTGFGGYFDLDSGAGIGVSTLEGDSFLASTTFGGTPLELFGNEFLSHGITDDGFMVWGDGYGEFEVDSFPYFPQLLPDDELKPHNLSAPLWHDFFIVRDTTENWGITLAAAAPVVAIVEYDNPWPFFASGPIGDFQVVHWATDDTPGLYEIIYAFDNTDMSAIAENWIDFVTVGLENDDGTAAITFLNQGDETVITDDLQICFDSVPALGPPHVMTYEATVDEGTDGTFVTNTAWHINSNSGAKQEAASVEIGLGDVDAPVWNGAELTVHDKLSDSLRLEWDAATDNVAVFAYDVYVNGGHAGTVGPSTFDFHVGGLVPQSFNEFAVIARDEVGNESVPLETSATMATDFLDDDFSIFEDDIEWANGNGLFFGCNPPANTLVCPDLNLTRGQLAALIARALDLPPGPDAFGDDDGHVFEGDINAIAAAGIAHGCAPGQFCPDDPATRAQLAAMFKAAFGLPDTATDYASDDDGHQFEDAINSMYETGITFGCGVDKYCPDDPLTRGMASAFFRRAFRWKGWW